MAPADTLLHVRLYECMCEHVNTSRVCTSCAACKDRKELQLLHLGPGANALARLTLRNQSSFCLQPQGYATRVPPPCNHRAKLLANVQHVASVLIVLKAAFPRADVSKVVSRMPKLLLLPLSQLQDDADKASKDARAYGWVLEV